MNFRLKRLADEKSKSDKNKDKKEDKKSKKEEDIDIEDLGPPDELLDFSNDDIEDVETKDISTDEDQEKDESEETDEELDDLLDERDSEEENSDEDDGEPDDLRGSLEDQVNTSDPSMSQPSLNPEMAQQEENQTKQIADKGRDIVEKIEEYKFFVDQMSKNMKANPALADAVKEKEQDLEQASQKIYDVVYEMENMDVMKQYENPLMGIPNEDEDEGSFGSEPTNFTDNEEDKDSGLGEDSGSDFLDAPPADSPNDLLDMFGEAGFSDLMGGEPPSDEGEEEEIDVPPPKQTKVEPKGKPKK